MTRNQENILIDLCLIALIVLFIGATCQASQNVQAQETQTSETK